MLLFNHKQRFVFDFQYIYIYMQTTKCDGITQKKPYKWNDGGDEWTNVSHINTTTNRIYTCTKIYILREWKNEEEEESCHDMTMRCTGFCMPKFDNWWKAYRRHALAGFTKAQTPTPPTTTTNQIMSIWISLSVCVCVLDVQRFILLVLSQRDNQHARLANGSQGFELNAFKMRLPSLCARNDYVCVDLCDKGKPKYRWQINENDNNNSEMDQNSQAKREANSQFTHSIFTSNAFRLFAHMFLRFVSFVTFLVLFILFQSTVFIHCFCLNWIWPSDFSCAFAIHCSYCCCCCCYLSSLFVHSC